MQTKRSVDQVVALMKSRLQALPRAQFFSARIDSCPDSSEIQKRDFSVAMSRKRGGVIHELKACAGEIVERAVNTLLERDAPSELNTEAVRPRNLPPAFV